MSCCAVGCTNRFDKNNKTRKFYRIPSNRTPFKANRRRLWLQAIRRSDWDERIIKNAKICSDHFISGEASEEYDSPDFVPSIFPNPTLCSKNGDTKFHRNKRRRQRDETPGRCPNKEYQPTSTCLSPNDSGMETDEVSLTRLTRDFLKLLQASPDGSVNLREAVKSLQTRQRRVYDITNVLSGIDLIEKTSKNIVKWKGRCLISSLQSTNAQKQKELENLKRVEETLDNLIKSCARQLFDMTDDVENSAWAYVTLNDLQRLPVFQDQTVIAVKAPEETKLEIPAPREDVIQIHLQAVRGSIMVLTCEVGSEGTTTSDIAEKSRVFQNPEESRIKTSTLHKESSGQQSAVQSA
ncbi:transcription factor E2F6-like isoform X3 [Halichoeres trimaculatus]|uniref:transcription factor E2F6-like isoform X3 n=1 Tax=Halichoeres trimaculatus TaxID=147232 RepID=UPI003D9E8134